LDQPSKERATGLIQLNERTREIFRHIVESYLATGEPVGSRNLSRHLPMTLSPASVRNVMSDLEHLGLIYAPHTSAGRLPTQTGLRLFVDGLLEVGNLTDDERRQIEAQVRVKRQRSVDQVLAEAGDMISGLSHCAGLVISEKRDGHLKHIEFVPLEPGKALVVLVGEDQSVENRVINIPRGLPPSALVEATNYLNAHIRGLNLVEARSTIERQLTTAKAELDALTKKVIEAGLRQLFDDLEAKRELVQLLGLAEKGDGVHIFIGSENQLFSLSGSSLIVSPFRDSSRKIVGVLGVIGPTRLNYARIIPMVDYTARLISRTLT
jgi:heat-inducible transcriptional repressor